ncbi:hypothetical protein CC78DRAFT_567543 [Lojkania enalia]|uniref:Uncharacterized protein n=1 Tax=Lojkania enalia TaxID=147567 RepID=A0A9P4N506_9PLEO|nr:hypothetical protein CC78DRAFT_567543 [Didymosphaeria enalia]
MELYIERKWARPHTGKTFPLMELPVELRLGVYRYILVQNDPIELWPHVKNNTMYCANNYRRQGFREYRSLNSVRRLLRVSSVVNEEASQIYYGENQFRFSGINGWMVFSAFLYTIGPRHSRFLTHITIHVPFPGRDYLALPTSVNHILNERICQFRPQQHIHFGTAIRRYGLKIPDIWTYDGSIRDCVSKLTTSNLRTFRLVLPPTYYIDHSSRLTYYWDLLKQLKDTLDAAREDQSREPLDFGFIFLRIRDEELVTLENAQIFAPYLWRYTGQVKRMIEIVRHTDWITGIQYGVHDRKGKYEVMGRDACIGITGPNAFMKEQLQEEDWKEAAV